ncbi:hypothetical protein D1007_02649 [Hordeum vulgare]|nr:hypothetical protein D1007_02649 [Hordeum vulgare]
MTKRRRGADAAGDGGLRAHQHERQWVWVGLEEMLVLFTDENVAIPELEWPSRNRPWRSQPSWWIPPPASGTLTWLATASNMADWVGAQPWAPTPPRIIVPVA